MSEKKIKFLFGTHSDFSLDIKKQVEEYFCQKRISRFANVEMIVITSLLFFVYLGAYVLILTGRFSSGIMLLLAIAMGLSFPSIFLNIAHNASHHALSANKKLNKLLLHALELI